MIIKVLEGEIRGIRAASMKQGKTPVFLGTPIKVNGIKVRWVHTNLLLGVPERMAKAVVCDADDFMFFAYYGADLTVDAKIVSMSPPIVAYPFTASAFVIDADVRIHDGFDFPDKGVDNLRLAFRNYRCAAFLQGLGYKGFKHTIRFKKRYLVIQ